MNRIMSRETHIQWRTGAVLLAGGLAVAACSGENGSGFANEPKNNLIVLEEFGPANDSASGLDCDFSDIPELEKGTVLVDGRCDQDPDAPVGVYAAPNQQSEAVTRFDTGQLLQAECTVEGENIVDANHLAGEALNGTTWVKIKVRGEPEAYIPATWVHGEQALEVCQETNA